MPKQSFSTGTARPDIHPAALSGSGPKFVTIDNWCALTSLSRRVSYDRIGSGELVAIKVGNRTLIDFEAGLAWLRSRPPAVIRAPRPRQQQAA